MRHHMASKEVDQVLVSLLRKHGEPLRQRPCVELNSNDGTARLQSFFYAMRVRTLYAKHKLEVDPLDTTISVQRSTSHFSSTFITCRACRACLGPLLCREYSSSDQSRDTPSVCLDLDVQHAHHACHRDVSRYVRVFSSTFC